MIDKGLKHRSGQIRVADTSIALLILGMVLYLNSQVVLLSLLADQALMMSWVVIPGLLFIFFIPQLSANVHHSVIALLTLLFLFILSIHILVQGVRYGTIGAGWALVSYGLWLILSWIQFANLKIVLWLGMSIFFSSALMQASAILIENYFSQAFFKAVTIGEVSRFYGISSSISIAGLQIAVGMLASISLYFKASSKFARILYPLISVVLAIALLLASARAPIIYSLIALVFLIMAIIYQGTSVRKLLTVLFIGCLTIGVIAIYDSYHGDIKLKFINQAFSFDDAGNQGRLGQFRISVQLFINDWWNPFVGYGAAELTQLSAAFGEGEFASESSLIKALLELGIIGLMPIMILLGIILIGVISKCRDPLIRKHIVFFVLLLLVLLQSLTQETFKTWIGSFYLVYTLGVCVRLLVEVGFLKRPFRLPLLPTSRK